MTNTKDIKQIGAVLFIVVIMVAIYLSMEYHNEEPVGKNVILIGVDGMSTDGFQLANTPNMNRLAREGVVSLHTRAVMPSVSSPNWSAILCGAGPEQTGITSNGWSVENHMLSPAEMDIDGYFPSIFTVLREQVPEAKLAAFYDWEGLGRLFNQSYLDTCLYLKDHFAVFNEAIPYITEQKPELAFVYVGHPDNAGHEFGHGSAEYYQSIEIIDSLIGELVTALRRAEMYDNAHIMIVSDHGGVGYGHGGESMAEMEVPWIMKGPSVVTNEALLQPNNSFNTASVIAYLFELKQPDSWIGRPYYAAFKKFELRYDYYGPYLPYPAKSLESGIYTEPQTLELTSEKEREIYYTYDMDLGRKPYDLLDEQPIELNKSAILRTVVKQGDYFSEERMLDFKLVFPPKSFSLSAEPSAKYNAGGNAALFDRELASADFMDGKWLGFEGTDLIVEVQLEEEKKIDAIEVSLLKNPYSWIFLPELIRVNNTHDFMIYHNGYPDGKNMIRIELNGEKHSRIKIAFKNTGVCPEGHPGAGKPAWMFVDEILIQ